MDNRIKQIQGYEEQIHSLLTSLLSHKSTFKKKGPAISLL